MSASHVVMVSTSKLLAGCPESIEQVKKEWVRTGWVLVDLTSSEEGGDSEAETTKLLSLARSATSHSTEQFAKWITENGSKKSDQLRSKQSPVLGYVVAPHKESLRFLSGAKQLDEYQSQLDPGLQEGLGGLFDASRAYEDLMAVLTDRFAAPIFERDSLESLKQAAGLTDGFGMVDFAYYWNDDAHPRSEFLKSTGLNCVDHYDPGLFTLSFISSAPGLQMFDYDSNTWVDMPVCDVGTEPTVGVLWTGGAAVGLSGGTIKPGKHRVEFVAGAPRVAVWHEVCIQSQIYDQKVIAALDRRLKNDSIFIPSVGSAGLTIKSHDVMRNSPLAGSATKIEKDSKIITAVEYDMGIALSKAIRPQTFNSQPRMAPHLESELGVSLADIQGPPHPKPSTKNTKNTKKHKFNFLNSLEGDLGLSASKSGIDPPDEHPVEPIGAETSNCLLQ